jgi:hypothetical protein
MSGRFYQNLGLTLLVLPVLVAIVIQLVTGSVVRTTPAEIIGQGSTANGSYTAFVIGFSFHWAVLLPLPVSFIAGLSCLVISCRRMR